MFYHDKQLQYTVRVDTPSPLFAKMLQQAIGGVEGEIRVMMQYLFQAWGSRGPTKYRDLLMETGTEEIGHIEMLATAVAMNLEGSPASVQEEAAKANPMIAAVLGGMNPRHFLSTGMAATPEDANGTPFDASHVYASGNIMADMYANVTAEATGRVLATRLYEMTDDPGMKDMLRFLIARDTMHQQQWLAVIEELGGTQGLPIPNSFPQNQELQEVSYTFFSTSVEGVEPPTGRWSSGPSLDGKGVFTTRALKPMGQEPKLAPPIPQGHAQTEQMTGGLSGALKNVTNRVEDAVGNSRRPDHGQS
ncbi:manganese catalase family protein [Deinococcus peraridilitoris]|uniref:Mn-containing catalase n=1 Tax=Deinococcus peraridilitoris (strain DSM 19664 / LMG 22246 / CIP 109416 / KR-200) TaxID=937777 RepID=L0A5T5_DEIPD|nr:manganese catalase family protein [Deinococcus peraridilitoris]AFZ68380.1 Mn-containing catalase [Deinococcus peraridilitoris DSM 19664]